MTDLTAVAYTSEATRELTADDIDRLLSDARSFNAGVCVTGVLLYHRGCFFQYFEGAADDVDQVYGRIRAATTHHKLTELVRKPIPRRQFESWHMGFCEPPATLLQQLANASWEDAMPHTRSSYTLSQGIALLVYYWNRWQAEARSGDFQPLLGSV